MFNFNYDYPPEWDEPDDDEIEQHDDDYEPDDYDEPDDTLSFREQMYNRFN